MSDKEPIPLDYDTPQREGPATKIIVLVLIGLVALYMVAMVVGAIT